MLYQEMISHCNCSCGFYVAEGRGSHASLEKVSSTLGAVHFSYILLLTYVIFVS
jgi:hypothetical protein